MLNPEPRTLNPPLDCRRCGKAYVVPAGLAMASCPHCGASARPLWLRLRDNRNAAVLALAALATLTAGVLLPFISLSQLGHENVYSMLGGIRELFDRGNVYLGLILLVFSVLFPYAKLAAILLATSRLAAMSPAARRRLAHVAHITGRYSLLDLLVVAILIVVVKFEGMAEARALSGTYWFGAAVFLSMAAGLCVNLDHLPQRAKDQTHE